MFPYRVSLPSVAGAVESKRDLAFRNRAGRGNEKAASARKTRPGINLRSGVRVGSRNVLSVSEDNRIPYLSNELQSQRGYSETVRDEEA